MGEEVTIKDAESLDTYTVDDRGRVTIGNDYKGEQVRVAFAVVDNEDN